MDTYADERDRRLLENDRYTFFVLKRVMDTDCTLLVSDHERLIVCFTEAPYPVWIWTSDDASREEMEKAYRIAADNSFLDSSHTINLKYELADHFIARASSEGIKLSIKMNMFAYDCPEPVKPSVTADGSIYRCTPEDTDVLTEFISLFHKETGIDNKSMEEYRKDAEEYINSGNMYMWLDEHGNKTASCQYRTSGDMASVGLVFTRPEYRRKHYAENLVYRVTEIAKEQGFLPMLYTNADYAASNACYEKIGYILRGKLCTIG